MKRPLELWHLVIVSILGIMMVPFSNGTLVGLRWSCFERMKETEE